VYLQYTETSYNIAANTSNVSWVAFRHPNTVVSAGNGTWSAASAGWSFDVQINGVSLASGASSSYRWKPSNDVQPVDKEYFNGTSTVSDSYHSGTITITHSADGTKTVSTYVYDGGGYFGSATCSGSYVLSDLI
jgi:hypothetical protein